MLFLFSLAFLLGLALTFWIHRHYQIGVEIPAAPPPDAPPLISVIVPARNEAANIWRCVSALLAQTWPNLEIIVLNDCSTDDTAQILAQLVHQDSRLKVIDGRPLPAGWAGKPHAIHQAVQHAGGDLFCFMDADTFAQPELLASAVQAMQTHRADLFTLMTFQELGSFWEKTLLPIVFTGLAVGFPAERVNNPALPDAIANGQFILIRQPVYQAVGGHAAIRGSIVEDKDLAERVKGSGYRLILGDGRALASTRMYTSLGSMWEGWTKNIYLGLRTRPGLLALGILGAFLAGLAWPAWVLGSALWLTHDGGAQAGCFFGEGILLGSVVMAQRARWARGFGISGWYALTLPLGAALFGAMMLASAWMVITGHGVIWKGRRYR